MLVPVCEAFYFFKFKLLALLLNVLWSLDFDWLPVIQAITFFICVDFVRAFRSLLDIEVNFDRSALYVLAIHFQKRILRWLVGLKLNVRKSLWLLSLPVSCQSDRLDLAKSSESVTHIIFFKCVGKSFYKQSSTVVRHLFGDFN